MAPRMVRLPREAAVQRLRDDADAYMRTAEDHERQASEARRWALVYRDRADRIEAQPGVAWLQEREVIA